MDQTTLLGFAYLLLGAACGGSFGLPSKFAPKDTPWENLWGPFFLIVTVLMPLVFGPLLVNDLFALLGHGGAAVLALPLLFGLLWGAGSMTLGMSFAFIGLSLAYALNYGAQIVVGAVGPMLLHHREQFATAQGAGVLAGVAVCVAGVVISGWAGILKDRSLRRDAAPAVTNRQPRMFAGLLLAVFSGALCACYSLALSYTDPISKAATDEFGNAPWQASCAIAAIILWGGAVSSCGYCAALLTRNSTWKNFAAPGAGRTLLVALAMAVLHNGAIYLLNLGFPMLGTLGVSVGYASLMSFAIIVGNIHGFRTGEWRGASAQSVLWIVAGIATLIAGVCVLGWGRTLGS
jgi:L-rhamnose-H+ transport protein